MKNSTHTGQSGSSQKDELGIVEREGAVSRWYQTRDRKEQLTQLSSGHEDRGDDPSPGTSWFFRSLNCILVFNDFNGINSNKNNNIS